MSKRRTSPPILDIDRKDVEQMLARADAQMAPPDVALIKALVESLVQMLALVRERGTTIARLRRLFGVSGSEKSRDVLSKTPGPSDAPTANTTSGLEAGAHDGVGQPASAPPSPAEEPQKPKPKGHGRIPASAYGAAQHIPVAHAELHVGDRCPRCTAGSLYRLKDAVPIVRLVGSAPLVARCWDCESLRCSACGVVHTARAPEEAQGPKYDETAASMLAMLRYGAGMPLNRLDHLQRDLKTPVPSSTQWDLLDERVELLRPAYNELLRLAAQGDVVHNDDSYVRILSFMGKRRAALVAAGKLPDPERTGLFTTAVVSQLAAVGPIAVFFTGRKHAGENLDQLLDLRDTALGPPILMSDALSRNVPARHPTQESNCITHGRRGIVDQLENHPAVCRALLACIALIYKVDKECKQRGLSEEDRLRAHQTHSGPVMADLRARMLAEFEQKRVEPNSALGGALNYFLKRWEKFTLFLRVPGAPLDNNIVERALKKPILQRNASLFFRSLHGANVGDIYLALIYTAELHQENPVEYLTALQRNAKAVAARPADWMPWNYRQTLAGAQRNASATANVAA
jgi:hypothetical protein